MGTLLIGSTLNKSQIMIDFNDVLNNPDKYKSKQISDRNDNLSIGMKVRCYEQDSDDLNHFVGYGIIHEVYDNNQAWVIAPKTEDQPKLDYHYYVIPT